MFDNPTTLPAKTYMVGMFLKADTTSLAVDIDCAEAVAWVMTDSEFDEFKAGTCSYSESGVGSVQDCEVYHEPVKAGSGKHIDIPLTGGPGETLNYVLYNPTDSDCTITRGHWHSSDGSTIPAFAYALVGIVAVGVLACGIRWKMSKNNSEQGKDGAGIGL